LAEPREFSDREPSDRESPDESPARPRVALVSTHGYVAAEPPLGAADTGGQVVYVLELARKLGQLGYDVDIWTRRFEAQAEIEPVADHVRILRARCGGNEFIPKEYLGRHLLEWSEHALRFIHANRLAYHFIDSHYWDGGIAGQRLAEALAVPHIHTPHSLGIWKRRQMETDSPDSAAAFEAEFNFTERIRAETRLYRDCDLVIATTPPQLDLIIADYEVPPSRVHLIPPGYDDNRFFPVSEASRQMIRQRLGFTRPTILSLGRLATNKGYDLLVDSFELVAARIPDVELNLAIGGEALDEHEAALLADLKARVGSLGLGERVRFTGFVPDDQLPDMYRAADIFALSSRYEPFGMTAIEAMASGTATVITVHGGLWRAVSFGRHALYADPFDREDLAIMMVKLLRHPGLRARLQRMGAHKARSLFTWTGVAQQLIGLVEGRRRPKVLDDADWDEPWNEGD
jgi:mannosylfructose-phosphate synthase